MRPVIFRSINSFLRIKKFVGETSVGETSCRRNVCAPLQQSMNQRRPLCSSDTRHTSPHCSQPTSSVAPPFQPSMSIPFSPNVLSVLLILLKMRFLNTPSIQKLEPAHSELKPSPIRSVLLHRLKSK